MTTYTRYVKAGPFTNNSTSPPINAAFLNGLETAVGTLTIPAPAPTGSDQTADLTAAALEAQATSGTLLLQPGHYVGNIATSQSFTQPTIIGPGMNLCTIAGATTSAPVLRFKGGSGQPSGGFFGGFTVQNTGGIGVQIADANGMSWSRVRASGALAEGIQFLNEATGSFTEYNAGDIVIDSTVTLPVHYVVGSGSDSFHGTGLTHGTLINLAAASVGPVIKIDSGAFPYAAPLTAAIFARGNNAAIIRNDNTSSPSFFGALDVEIQGNVSGVMVGDTAGQRILYRGTVGNLITGTTARLGNLYRAKTIYYLAGAPIADLEPYLLSTPLASTATTIAPLIGSHAHIQVDISATNYHYAYTLECWQSPYASTGNVAVIATHSTLNTAGYGAPSFSWTAYGLTVTNGSYTSAVTAYVRVVPAATFPNQADVFRQ